MNYGYQIHLHTYTFSCFFDEQYRWRGFGKNRNITKWFFIIVIGCPFARILNFILPNNDIYKFTYSWGAWHTHTNTHT